MKKIIIGLAALCLLSTTTAYAGKGKKKSKKAKAAKVECCKPDKCSDKTAICPPVPGCCK